MSRLIADDFVSLISFLNQYNLSEKIANTEFQPNLKSIHKRYLSLLTLLVEVESQSNNCGQMLDAEFAKTFAYFQESVSDIGSAYFCFIHGILKPSRIMIRSSIETILKGITAAEFPNVLVTKSVFAVLDEAKKTLFFTPPIEKKLFNQLTTIYGELCKDVHTATVKNMAHLSALNTFPSFEKKTSDETGKILIDVSKIILELGCIYYGENFLKMHFENKEIVNPCLSKATKKYLNGH